MNKRALEEILARTTSLLTREQVEEWWEEGFITDLERDELLQKIDSEKGAQV